jgi:uncharacterized lipoprotein YajG
MCAQSITKQFEKRNSDAVSKYRSSGNLEILAKRRQYRQLTPNVNEMSMSASLHAESNEI